MKNNRKTSFKNRIIWILLILTGLVISLLAITNKLIIFLIFCCILALFVELNRFLSECRGIKEMVDVTQIDTDKLYYSENEMLVKELVSKIDQQERALRTVLHNLKNPITNIESYAQSIKDGIYPYDTLEGSIDVILENSQRMTSQVTKLLQLDYLNSLTTSNTQSFKMNKLISEITSEMKVRLELINLEVDIEVVDYIGEVEAWRIAIENIIENAIRYAKSTIKIELNKDHLAISNDGPELENNSEIFIEHQKGKKGNFGLGLSITKRIVEMYGYEIAATNDDFGVCFKIVSK